MTTSEETFEGSAAGLRHGGEVARPARWPSVSTATAAAAIAGLVALGLWISFRYARAAWEPDGDIFVTISLWRGFQEHGLSFFSSWNYTQDNWLFSLIPIASAAFAVFGATGQTALALGWVAFIVSVALAVWVTFQAANRTAALLVGCVLLFASFPALGSAGFLAHPISHNISMAWGLAAIAIAQRGLARQSIGACILAALAVFLNAVSDPWAGAAIALPIVIAGTLVAAAEADGRRYAGLLALGVFGSFIGARTRLFGALSFLPASHFELTDLPGLLANIHWGALGLAKMFNIVPGGRPSQFAVRVFDILALVVMVGGASISAVRSWRRTHPQARFVSAVAVLSVVAVTLLYMVGRWDSGPGAGRFFANLYFLGAILIANQAAFYWRAWPTWGRIGIGLYAGLFVLSGALKRPDLWLGPPPKTGREAAATRALGDYLDAHGLKYGYGPFWGTQALAMDTLTGGRVTVRPVSFRGGRIRRRPAETSSFWFQREAEPANARIFLVVENDGEECPDADVCEALAGKQFGTPAERLHHGDAVILVWHHPLVTQIAP